MRGLAAPLLLLVGCTLTPPALQPTACADDVDCPSDQRCIAAECAFEAEPPFDAGPLPTKDAGLPPPVVDAGSPRDDGGALNEDAGAPVFDAGDPEPDAGVVDAGPRCVDLDGDGRGEGCVLGGDCDDAHPGRYEGALEGCDGFDNNCDGVVDEGDACPCPAFTSTTGETYLLCDRLRRYDDARRSCRDLPGYALAVFETGAEADEVQALATGWIGLSDAETEGTFVWDDGTILDVGEARFDIGEPNGAATENCVEMRPLWHDLDCARARRFVCQNRAPSPVGDCVDSDGDGRGPGCRAGLDCDDDDPDAWRLIHPHLDEDDDGFTTLDSRPLCVGDTRPAAAAAAPQSVDDLDCDDLDNAAGARPCSPCYDTGTHRICMDNTREWNDARSFCINTFVSDLAVLDNFDEAMRVKDAARIVRDFTGGDDDFWIGLADFTGDETGHMWVDLNVVGDPRDPANPAFFDFGSTEPNNNGERCIELRASNGDWNDQDCSDPTIFGNENQRFICE